MKLPPLALTAPSLCPRCDAPAMFDDHCVQCALPLRLCGACRGVAGPFDRFCGFCGYELVQGEKRAPVWRLWLLLALVPLAAGLAFGLSPLALKVGPVAQLVGGTQQEPPRSPLPGPVLRSQNLALRYAIPSDWSMFDYTLAQPPQQFVVVYRSGNDRTEAAGAGGELIALQPSGPLLTLGRPPLNVSAVDAGDPQAVLGFQVSQLLAAPPTGVTYQVVKPVHAITVDRKPGAEVVLKVLRGGVTTYYQRVYVATGAQPLFRIEAVDTPSAWEGGDATRVESVVQSLTFGA